MNFLTPLLSQDKMTPQEAQELLKQDIRRRFSYPSTNSPEVDKRLASASRHCMELALECAMSGGDPITEKAVDAFEQGFILLREANFRKLMVEQEQKAQAARDEINDRPRIITP